MIEWSHLEYSLKTYFQNLNLELSEKEANYLKEAFNFTENLWINEFNKIEHIKFLMLSEAPLFGTNKNYFYNKETRFSSFFYFKDIEAFNVSFTENQYNDKEYALRILRDNGFMILDLFPFALNQHDTQFNFNTLNKSQYLKLFNIAVDAYLKSKLDLIKEKCDDNTVFIYRYKRLKQRLSGSLEELLEKQKFINLNTELDTLNNNMSLDREKLMKLVKKYK